MNEASTHPVRSLSRRRFLATTMLASVAIGRNACGAEETRKENVMKGELPTFLTRGVVILPSDAATWPWIAKAKAAGLTTIALHAGPAQSEPFAKSEEGRAFFAECRKQGIEVECEAHAVIDLLPRNLFAKDPTLFRMNDAGERVSDTNCCVSSPAAVEIICENAVKSAQVFRPTTSRYFYWIDDGQPMCRCPKCKGLSDTDQALVLENAMVKALKRFDDKAALAHLCYANTLKPPTQVKPDPGIFLEYAPIQRRYDKPLSCRDVSVHAELIDALDANLAVFGTEGAQALEYWLDVSRFSGWKRENLTKIPWNNEVFQDDLRFYAKRGIGHVTTFAVWLDGTYVQRFGDPPLDEYGKELLRRQDAH